MSGNYRIIKKAYIINQNKLDDCFEYHPSYYYGTRGSVKESLLADYGTCTIDGQDIDILNIPIKRYKEKDIIDFHGEEIKRCDIKEKKRELKIKLLDKNVQYMVQDARSYVGNSILWWAENRNGYTTDPYKAHIFSFEEIQNFNPRETDIIWPYEEIMKGVRSHVYTQYLDHNLKI